MAAPPISLQFSERRPRTAFIETPHTGKAPLKKNWSFYKRTGSVWEDWDHVPPARLALFSRPDLGLKAAQAINTHYEREKALADARLWEQAVSQAQQRQVFARRREANERLEDYAGQERTRSARPNSARAACTARECAQPAIRATAYYALRSRARRADARPAPRPRTRCAPAGRSRLRWLRHTRAGRVRSPPAGRARARARRHGCKGRISPRSARALWASSCRATHTSRVCRSRRPGASCPKARRSAPRRPPSARGGRPCRASGRGRRPACVAGEGCCGSPALGSWALRTGLSYFKNRLDVSLGSQKRWERTRLRQTQTRRPWWARPRLRACLRSRSQPMRPPRSTRSRRRQPMLPPRQPRRRRLSSAVLRHVRPQRPRRRPPRQLRRRPRRPPPRSRRRHPPRARQRRRERPRPHCRGTMRRVLACTTSRSSSSLTGEAQRGRAQPLCGHSHASDQPIINRPEHPSARAPTPPPPTQPSCAQYQALARVCAASDARRGGRDSGG